MRNKNWFFSVLPIFLIITNSNIRLIRKYVYQVLSSFQLDKQQFVTSLRNY